ncbi:DUF6461 domain-containing protein [Nocardia altamirensis]|uniref:DUF6461 domain-containing protein n=1 Tax=Nocardia altamirensis TaxID=472158 RepID=UPI0008405A29|nr:DUF6461 domain-containing protein [Nocardia altamirensis]
MSVDRGPSTAVAADYEWIGDLYQKLFHGYCLTLVREVTPREFMDRIGAQITFDALPLGKQFSDISWRRDEPDSGHFIGATTVAGADGDWTLALEMNGGYLGVTEEIIGPVSAATTLVSHYHCVGLGRFRCFEDGALRLGFEPLFSSDRWGSNPDGCLEQMRQIGFNLDEDREEIGPTTTAAFALAERLTGVRVTEDLLYSSEYLCGTVHIRDRLAPPTVVNSVPPSEA